MFALLVATWQALLSFHQCHEVTVFIMIAECAMYILAHPLTNRQLDVILQCYSAWKVFASLCLWPWTVVYFFHCFECCIFNFIFLHDSVMWCHSIVVTAKQSTTKGSHCLSVMLCFCWRHMYSFNNLIQNRWNWNIFQLVLCMSD